ncbi:biotin synthase [Pseudaquabacterium rugosum]|jgi:malonyl-CoA O-methyltransferase|uniref:Biotin synthase n=1 Tax=Pseudaquabacterium rugosum TaxID=2984194 RepID=A0ABU9B543_9BURK
MADTPLAAPDPAAVRHQRRRLARGEGAPWLHQEIARRMAERLVVIREPAAHWLDWGGFIGGGRAAVQSVWPAARVSVVEPDAALLARSRELAQGPWWRGRKPQWPVLAEQEVPAAGAGLLWANMQLHAAEDAGALITAWRRALQVGGYLMFSTFGPDTLAELREIYAEAGWPAPHPPYADMHDIGDALVQAGFADPVMDQEVLRLNWSGPAQLVAELRGLGGHLGRQRHPGLRTPRWRERLHAALARRADAQGRITMRFEVVYGHALRAAAHREDDGSTRVALDSLRDGQGRLRRR